ncbi:MAG: molybdenum cofactor biosynthesis F family protein [Oscillospiraceae bacterium]|jgi:phenolic acid decarboxylase|nr:molybdenum cofactor biosynthesis F family protein [Oscillospiraceae bacterium]
MRKLFTLLLAISLLLGSFSAALASEPEAITDLFYYVHSALTDEEISAKMSAAPLAPSNASTSEMLLGEKFDIVTDQGVTLTLDFAEDIFSVDVTVTESEPVSFKTEYSALTLNANVLFAFRVPDSTTAWIINIDTESGLVVAVEAWYALIESFFGVDPARETNRAIYTGYVVAAEVPTERPRATNRLTGKAILWEGDAGRVITTYGTRNWASFVPLGLPGPINTFTSSSDFYEIDHSTYFHTYTAIEFSGKLTAEVLDLYTMKLVGVNIGFNEYDEFGFSMYSADGTPLGQFASYGPFGYAEYPDRVFVEPEVTESAEEVAPPAEEEAPAEVEAAPPAFVMPKGTRFAYRPFTSALPLTLEEMNNLAKEQGDWKGAFGFPGKEAYMIPFTDELAGMSFILEYDDGKAYEYEISAEYDHSVDQNNLKFRPVGQEEWNEELYEAFEVDENIYMILHSLSDVYPKQCYISVIDLNTGLATLQYSTLSNEAHPRDPVTEFSFGIVKADGITPVDYRQGFTDELLGRSYTWTYGNNIASQHIYSSPNSYSFSILMNNEPMIMWSSAAAYVKISEYVYMFTWTENRGTGIQGTLLLNTKTMHDSGVCFGVNENLEFEINTFGAEARSAGSLDYIDYSELFK